MPSGTAEERDPATTGGMGTVGAVDARHMEARDGSSVKRLQHQKGGPLDVPVAASGGMSEADGSPDSQKEVLGTCAFGKSR